MRPCFYRGLDRTWILLVVIVLMFHSTALLFALDPHKRITQYDMRVYTAKDGLPMNSLKKVFQDSKGYIWIGTQEGLVRFDGAEFHIYNKSKFPGLKSNWIWDIDEDSQGNLWLATNGGGVSRFDGLSFITIDTTDGLAHMIVNKVLVQNDSAIWCGTIQGLTKIGQNGIIHRGDGKLWDDYIQSLFLAEQERIFAGVFNPDLIMIDHDRAQNLRINFWISCFCKGSNGNLFWGTSQGDVWLTGFPSADSFPIKMIKLLHVKSTVRDLHQDKDGNLWIITDGNGIFRYSHGKVENLSVNNGLKGENDFFTSICEDQEGNLWFTSDFGLLELKDNKFTPFGKPEGFISNYGHTICEDLDGNIWTGMRDSGIFAINSHQVNTFSDFQRNAIGVVCSIFPRKMGGVWVGTDLGLYIARESGNVTMIDLPSNLYIKSVNALLESQSQLFIGIRGFLVEYTKQRFKTYNLQGAGVSQDITSIALTGRDSIWVGTMSDGVYRIINDRATRLGVVEALRSDGITTMFSDSDSTLWIASENNGLYQYSQGSYHNFRALDGLYTDRIFSILEDDSSRLWFASNRGIFFIRKHQFSDYVNKTIPKLEYSNFSHLDGMREAECNGRRHPTAWKARDGKLWFTTIAGAVCIDPNHIPKNLIKPPVYIEEIVATDTLYRFSFVPVRLKAKERNLEIRYTALSFVVPERVLFKYKLEGYDQEWVDAETRRKAFYTNLRPGRYTFRVIACNNDGVWNEQGANQALVIPPFLWETWWAEIGYGLLFFAFVGWLARAYYKNKEFKAEVQRRQEHAARLAELDQAKSQFFANISHEFRTPLTVIRTPLDDLIAGKYKGDRFELFRSMKRQADRLLTLINQLLDLSRLESSQLALQTTAHDLIFFCRTLIVSLQSLAQDRGIALTFSAANQHLYALIDHDKVEKILVNLVSNAIKFTPIGGSVDVTLRTLVDDEAANDPPAADEQARSWVEIAVQDTGIGISPELLPHIFERFFRGNDPYIREYQGAGIGLSLAKEMAVLHGGDITVESVEGEGSCFRLLLPLEAATSAQAAPLNKTVDIDPLIPKSMRQRQAVDDDEPAPQTHADNATAVVLVVEDEADMRGLIRTQLNQTCTVLEASDGAEGFDQAVKEIPDLIICDVMMPKMDGMQLCRLLKNDDRTSHIPVILLTALARQENKLQGLETGADDYLVKPFETAELSVRVRNLIEIRRKLYQRLTIPGPLRSLSAKEPKDQFIAKLAAIVNDHLSEENFGVKDLADTIGWSRRQLYRKLKAVMNQTPERFIYIVKLEFARQQLQTTSSSISEIAFQAGFSSPAHFSKLFREYFEVTPRMYRKTAGKGSSRGKSEGLINKGPIIQ